LCSLQVGEEIDCNAEVTRFRFVYTKCGMCVCFYVWHNVSVLAGNLQGPTVMLPCRAKLHRKVLVPHSNLCVQGCC